MKQVLTILLSNAIETTPASGNIVVSLDLSDGQARLQVRAGGNGGAADPSHLRSFPGSLDSALICTRRDLDMEVIRHVVELHGGSVRAEAPGRNGSLTLSLPLLGVANRTSRRR